jgi:protein-L-isoaspartate O-methyltransferase
LLAQIYRNIPNSFLDFDISSFVHDQNTAKFTFSNQNRFPFDIALLADQLAIYPKAKFKLPSFTKVFAQFTPQSFEQSSSERIACYKASLINGHTLLDLCGGLGVDDWAFSRSFSQVDSLDINAQLNKLVRKNFEKLGVENILRMDGDAYDFIKGNSEKYDWVYLDADRRVGANRAFSLAQTEPNILKVKDPLFAFTNRILLKVSPMMDLQLLVEELESVVQIWVLTSKNEVKEVLVELGQKRAADIQVHAVNLDDFEAQLFDGPLMNGIKPNYGYAGDYFYEPALALIKSGLASSYLEKFKITQLAINSIYGVGPSWIPDFFGRGFKVLHAEVFSKSKCAEYLRQHQIMKSNIARRNFKMDVEEIRKQFGLKDGGDVYLFFTENHLGEKMFFHCVKVQNQHLLI